MPRKPTRNLPPINIGNETIGERIAILRKERGYTQKELADKIGISQTIVSDYEKGRLRLYDEMVIRFSIALNVSADSLLGLKQNKTKKILTSLKLLRRFKNIEKLPREKQRALLKTIDVYLESEGINKNK